MRKKCNIEKEMKKKLTEVDENFRKAAIKEKQSMNSQYDSNFWTCIVFQSEAQAREFSEKLVEVKRLIDIVKEPLEKTLIEGCRIIVELDLHRSRLLSTRTVFLRFAWYSRNPFLY